MMNKVILAGGSGYLGTLLAKYFSTRAKEVIVLSRGARNSKDNIRFVSWDAKNPGSWISELENTDLLINLTGKNVNCRYTLKNKLEIYHHEFNQHVHWEKRSSIVKHHQRFGSMRALLRSTLIPVTRS